MDHNRVCVIGAGPSGLTVIKGLKQAGISDVVCLEASDYIGGIWNYKADQEEPSVYSTAHTITSRTVSGFSDFPIKSDYPDFPSHRQILAYMREYAEHFDVLRHVRFRSNVDQVRRLEDGRWQIDISGEEGTTGRTADYLVVCSGHHRSASMPPLKGEFSGEQVHTIRYKTAEPFAGKRVLVVGAGNSACDIAVACSRVSHEVGISVRTPQFILPKIMFGRPTDKQYRKLNRLPWRVRTWVLEMLSRLLTGPYESYGLPDPDYPILGKHLTLNTDLLTQIRHGNIQTYRGIAHAAGETIHFVDGTKADFDTIIWATGFRTDIPFMGDICAGWGEAAELPLYKKMMLADQPGLAFVGLVQPIGCIWTLAEQQGRLVAAEVAGTWSRPADMASSIERELARNRKRYVASSRHALQVEGYEYARELQALYGARQAA